MVQRTEPHMGRDTCGHLSSKTKAIIM